MHYVKLSEQSSTETLTKGAPTSSTNTAGYHTGQGSSLYFYVAVILLIVVLGVSNVGIMQQINYLNGELDILRFKITQHQQLELADDSRISGQSSDNDSDVTDLNLLNGTLAPTDATPPQVDSVANMTSLRRRRRNASAGDDDRSVRTTPAREWKLPSKTYLLIQMITYSSYFNRCISIICVRVVMINHHKKQCDY